VSPHSDSVDILMRLFLQDLMSADGFMNFG
jgi:hypothetical protein